jgi:nucleoside-diphosphate-sugar epimerase
MNILITGGAGYVGVRLANRLAIQGHNVTVLDTFLYYNYANLDALLPNIKKVKGNILDSKKVEKTMQGIDIIYHLAAVSNDPTGDLDEKITTDINVKGTEIVLDKAKKADIKQFVYASSSSVFGIQDCENVTEAIEPKPLTIYSKTKLEAEEMVINTPDFVTTAVRPATICGVSPRQRFDLIVNALTGSAFFDKKIIVYGGDQRRPNLTMTDMLSIYTKLLYVDKNKINGQVFNAGWENNTIHELARIVRKAAERLMHTKIPIIREKTTDNRDYHISSQKIEKVLGFYPKRVIATMVKQLIILMSNGFIGYYKQIKYHNIGVLNEQHHAMLR